MMMRTFAVASSVVAIFCAAAGAPAQHTGDGGRDAPRPMPQAWDTSYVMLLELDPSYAPASEEARQAVIQAHFQFQLGLLADGRTIRGGPLAPEPGAALVGITVLRAASLDEARAIVAEDPAVLAGVLRATVRTWITPADAGGDADAGLPNGARGDPRQSQR